MAIDNRANNMPPTFAALREMWEGREQSYRQERERLLALLREAYIVLATASYLPSHQEAADDVAARIAHVLDVR